MDAASVTRDSVLALYRREQELRTSDEVQDLYDMYGRSGIRDSGSTRPIVVEDVVQWKVLMEFGYEATDANLDQYRSLRALWQHDAEVRDAILYIRYDISKSATMAEGEPAVDVPLHTLTGGNTTLLSLRQGDKPLVILAGSLT